MEGYRDEIRLCCYRMAGSLQDAEGLAEAAFLKAGSLPLPLADGESARTELFKISSRLCAETLTGQPPRVLPSLCGPPSDPFQPPLPADEDKFWLEPLPDDLYREGGNGGKILYAGRESISLPFMEALQSLRPPQRLCVILGDVMGWEIERVAEVLGAGLAETEDSLEEARASMSRTYDEELGRREPPPEEVTTELMMRYLYAWETGDLEGLAARLSKDTVLQLPPSPSWYEGRDAVRTHLGSHPLQERAAGRWRLLPRRANGQLAFGVYRRDDARRIYAAHSIQVLHFAGELVSEIISFEDPWLFMPFKLLPEIVVQG